MTASDSFDHAPEADQMVIAAFLDDEVVLPADLDAALSTPAGRRYLIDLLAMRGVAHTHPAVHAADKAAAVRPRSRVQWLAAAALVVSTLAGYLAGAHRRPSAPAAQTTEAFATGASDVPAPTQVIRFEPGVNWHVVNGGQ